jgi:uncharacterized protein
MIYELVRRDGANAMTPGSHSGAAARRTGTLATARLVALTLAASGCALAGPSLGHVAPPPAKLDARTVVFASASGSLIHAWLSKGRPGAGAVLLLHGVGSNRESMLGRAQFLHDEGFTVLAPDFQAHGESPGDHVTFGARESLDAAAAVAYLREVAPSERVGVIGVSMGGAATLLGPGPITANAFVLESVYPTIREALSDRLATWFWPFSPVGRWFTSPLIDVVASEIGVKETDLQPIDRIGKISAPLLLIAGTADPYTPLVEAESLYARARGRKSFWAVPGAGHEDLHAFAPREYEQRVGSFLTRCLRTGTDSTTTGC